MINQRPIGPVALSVLDVGPGNQVMAAAEAANSHSCGLSEVHFERSLS